MADETTPTLSARLNQLFVTFHTRSESEQSTADVAQAVSTIMKRPVSPDSLDAIRSGAHDDAAAPVDPEILGALTQHFPVPGEYLVGDDPTVRAIDRQLRLLAAARDAGVRDLALRGSVDIEQLTNHLATMSERVPVPSVER